MGNYIGSRTYVAAPRTVEGVEKLDGRGREVHHSVIEDKTPLRRLKVVFRGIDRMCFGVGSPQERPHKLTAAGVVGPDLGLHFVPLDIYLEVVSTPRV